MSVDEERDGVRLTNLDQPLFEGADATKRDRVEYHPTLADAERWDTTQMVLDIDPPTGGPFSAAVDAARLVAEALAEVGMAGAVKTSGAKGLHVFVPITPTAVDVVAAYSPRVRQATPVSFPVAWEELDRISPTDFTVRNAVAMLADSDPWAELLPVARVQAMHEGKRRARMRRGPVPTPASGKPPEPETPTTTLADLAPGE